MGIPPVYICIYGFRQDGGWISIWIWNRIYLKARHGIVSGNLQASLGYTWEETVNRKRARHCIGMVTPGITKKRFHGLKILAFVRRGGSNCISFAFLGYSSDIPISTFALPWSM